MKGVNFQIEEGHFASVMGPSGCGKSTLLHLLGGMQMPTSGEVVLLGKVLQHQTDEDLSRFRQNTIGFVFSVLPSFAAF